jgi:transglutaminase-like putative cysteine protease
MLFAGSIPARVFQVPSGEAGVRETLKVMVKVARTYKAHPLIRETARAAVAGCSDEPSCKAAALQSYVKERVEYLSDIWDVETLQTPIVTLGYREPSFGAYMDGGTASGDCDDHSTLLAALLLSIGVPGCFCAVGLNGEPISHVLVQARLRERERVEYLPLETIVPAPPGWFPPDVSDFMLAHFD